MMTFGPPSKKVNGTHLDDRVKSDNSKYHVVYSLHKRIWVKFHPQFTHKTQR